MCAIKLKGNLMKNYILASLLALTVVLVTTGCRGAQINNVPKQEIQVSKSNDDVFNAIKKAGTQLGWLITKQDNNTAIGTLNLRKHQAVVTINYSSNYYSITYKSSKELNYDAAKNTIHKNYNGWVQNLDNAIKIQLN